MIVQGGAFIIFFTAPLCFGSNGSRKSLIKSVCSPLWPKKLKGERLDTGLTWQTCFNQGDRLSVGQDEHERLENLDFLYDNYEAVNDAVKRMEIENGKLRAEIEACKLNALDSEWELKNVVKSEKGCTKRAADVEKETGVLLSQCEEEKKMVMEMKQEMLKAHKEAETKWRQETKTKEETLVGQETKMAEIQKAHSREQLPKLHQQAVIDEQLADDRHLNLEEDELSCPRIPHPLEDLLPENLDFLYNYDENSIFRIEYFVSPATRRTSKRWGHAVRIARL